jgi:hypothetical protein
MNALHRLRGTHSAWVWVACAVFAALQLAAFYPGYMSHDSAYQWWQARSGEITTLWPPGMVLMLQAMSPLQSAAPAALYTLHSLLYWLAAGYLASQQRNAWTQGFVLTALCVFPAVAICLPHVWSDVALAMWLLLICILLDRTTRAEAPPARCTAVLAIACAAMALSTLWRHNAWMALPPLLWFAASRWLQLRNPGQTPALKPRFIVAVTLFALSLLVYSVVPRLVSKIHADTWAITLIWDLQALSVATDKVLVPASISSNATLADLRQSFDPVNAVTLYVKSTSDWANSTTGLSRDQKADLVSAWAGAVMHAPLSYAKHRAHVFLKMIGPKRGVARDGSADDPVLLEFKDNPKLVFANPRLLLTAQSWVAWLKPQWWASPLVWIALATTLLGACLRSRSRSPGRVMRDQLPFWIWCSGIAYLLPLAVLSPTSDLRYALWPVVACVAAACLAIRNRSFDR